MKFNHIIAAAACALVMAPASLCAKEASELRVYINPGHGSWTGGDRNMGTIKHGEPQTINDTTGFFESNTNLWKCLAIVDRLEEYGLKLDRSLNADNPVRALQGCARDLSNNIFMSRVKNGPGPGSDEDDEAYNRSLSEISQEVQRNNFDMFISVHSNAAAAEFVNYPGFFVRGENKVAYVPGSDTNAATAWPYAFAQGHQNWSNYSMSNANVIYDIDFWQGDHLVTSIDGVEYKGYYGVLRHGVMGYMVEGYFHTYSPARLRAMNIDVCRDEGDTYARGIAAIFGLPLENNGTLYGIVRDKHEKFRHKYYSAPTKSDDNFMPLNNVKVDLLRDGNVIASYTTDDEWNGAFVFSHLAPGEYYISVAADGYKDAEPDQCGPFTVEAGKTTYPNVWLENVNYVPDTDIPVEYADEINSPLIKAADSYRMTASIEGREIAELQDKTIRRVIARGDNVYVLALDAEQLPTLLVLDSELNVKATLGTAACKGSDRNLADIQFTADGILIGSSESVTHYSAETIDNEDFNDTERGSVNFYRWDNDENGIPAGEARIWFNTLASGNLYRGSTANTFVYTGTSQNGSVCFPTASSYGVGRMFFSYIDVIDGEVQPFSYNNSGLNTDYLCTDNLGNDFTFTLAPYDTEEFIVNAPGVPARAFNITSLEAAGNVDPELLDNAVSSASFFKYAGHSYMAVPAAGGANLIDVTAGIDKARTAEVSIERAARAETNPVSAVAVGRTLVHFNDDGITDNAEIELYVADGNHFSKYTTAGTEQDVVAGVYAYGLNCTSDADEYTLSFNLTGDARARVELFADNAETVVAESGNYAKGANSVSFDLNSLPLATGVSYNWRVVVENKAVPALAPIFTRDDSGNGIAFNRNPESPAFGTAYYTSRTERAIFSVAPGFTFSEPMLKGQWDTSVGASPWRLALLPGGKVLISDWGDAQGGIYLFDPASPDSRSNFFAGTCNSASGEWTYDGHVIGGSTPGMSVLGTGDDTRLYTFQEDYPSDYSLTMACYNIGTAEQITSVPDQTFPNISAYMVNGNVDVIATPDWMVLSQVRGAGNNTKGVPSFMIASYNDEVIFNSADLDLSGSDGAIALTDDRSRLYMMDCSDVIHAYDIDLANAETPLKEAFTFKPSAAGEAYQMAFDHAGNLVIAGRSSFQAYTLPREATETVTPAPAAQSIDGPMGIEDLDGENSDADAPAEYFNLQGVRVAGSALTPGIYIERRGSVARKVIIR